MASPPLTNREYAYFQVSGHGSHMSFTNEIGIDPTTCWSEGDINPRTQRPYKFMAWHLESGLDDTHSIEEHIARLFEKLIPLETKLNKLSNNYELCIQCVGYFPSVVHGIHIDKQMISVAHKLALTFDYDFYYIDDNGHDLDYR